MSPGRTSLCHGFSTGNPTSSTSYAMRACDRVVVVIAVVTSCGQRCDGASEGIGTSGPTALSGAALSATPNSIGCACGGTRTVHTAFEGPCFGGTLSSVRFALFPTILGNTLEQEPTTSDNVRADAPTRNCRTNACPVAVMYSCTSAPPAEYSSTTPFRTCRIALNRPSSSSSGPRPTSSGLGAGS